MSIVKVAKLAGVSHATVSRVINRRSEVSPESVERVHEAMRQLKYVPSAKRRGPKPKASGVKTGNIGVFFVSETPTLGNSPIAASVLHAVEQAAAAQGFGVMIGQMTDTEALPRSLASGRVDGLLLHGYPPSAEMRRQLTRYPASVWLLSPRRKRGYWGDRVTPNNDQIGAMACRYLIDQGHKRLAALSCEPEHLGFETRIEAFADTAREAGLYCKTLVDSKPIPGMYEPTSQEWAQYESAVDQLVAGPGPMPTGLFIPRDVLTLRMYRVLRRRGIEPGRDIEIISCDNIPGLLGLDPRPATIDVRPDEVGRRAVEQLIARINDPGVPTNVTTMVEPRLVPGDAFDLAACAAVSNRLKAE